MAISTLLQLLVVFHLVIGFDVGTWLKGISQRCAYLKFAFSLSTALFNLRLAIVQDR